MKPTASNAAIQAIIVLVCSALFNTVNAASLGLVLDYPDSSDDSTNISTSYNSGNGNTTLTISDDNIFDASNSFQFPLGSQTYDLFSFNLDGSANENFYGDLNVSASFIDGVLSGGTFSLDISPGSSITSLENDLGLAPGSSAGTNLVTGTLTAFGFLGSGSAGRIEFLYDITGGHYGNYWPEGSFFIDITAGGPTGAWTIDSVIKSSWSGEGKSHSYVPVPAAAWLFGSGLIGLFGFMRRRK